MEHSIAEHEGGTNAIGAIRELIAENSSLRSEVKNLKKNDYEKAINVAPVYKSQIEVLKKTIEEKDVLIDELTIVRNHLYEDRDELNEKDNEIAEIRQELLGLQEVIKIQRTNRCQWDKKLQEKKRKIDDLKVELEYFKEKDTKKLKMECLVCEEYDREIVYFPCAHLAACKACNENLHALPIPLAMAKPKEVRCPLCNGVVKGFMEIHN